MNILVTDSTDGIGKVLADGLMSDPEGHLILCNRNISKAMLPSPRRNSCSI